MNIPRKPPYLTLETLKELLSYDKITEQRETVRWSKKDSYEILQFEVLPADDSLPCIYLVFDPEVSVLSQYGMGNWHCHFETYEDERRNVMDSVKLTRQLMNHYYCICEEVRANGEYGGSGPRRPNELPTTLRKDTAHLRRWFFGKAPVDEKIDFSRYIEEGVLYVEKSHRARIDRIESEMRRKK